MRKALYSYTLENLTIITFVGGSTASSFSAPITVEVARWVHTDVTVSGRAMSRRAQ